MKTLGLIGGMSWESTAHYYARINRLVAGRLGGLHSARLLLYSMEFHELQALQHADDWAGAARLLVDAARRLERAGAEGLVICANTMHIVAPEIGQAVPLPLIHIADAAATAVKRQGLRTVALLGTPLPWTSPFIVNGWSVGTLCACCSRMNRSGRRSTASFSRNCARARYGRLRGRCFSG